MQAQPVEGDGEWEVAWPEGLLHTQAYFCIFERMYSKEMHAASGEVLLLPLEPVSWWPRGPGNPPHAQMLQMHP